MQNDNILEIETTIEKPFLRWAGGKRWLIKHLPGLLSEAVLMIIMSLS